MLFRSRKYFLLSLFQIATSDEVDADEDEDLVQRQRQARRPAPPAPNMLKEITPKAKERARAEARDAFGLPGENEAVDPETGEILTEPPKPPGGPDAAPVVSAGDDTRGAGAARTIEDMAREAADRGSAVFRTFYRNRSGAEQMQVNKIGDDLRERMDAADAKLKARP